MSRLFLCADQPILCISRVFVNECKGTVWCTGASNGLGKIAGAARYRRPNPFEEKCLSIQFAVKVTACLALAGACTLMCAAQQANPPASSDSTSQTQPQDTAQQPAATTPTSPQQTSSQQAQPQQAQPPPASPQQPSDKGKEAPTNGGKVEGTSNDRLFYALPNFLSLQKGQKLPPLSAKDKFKVVALGTFDPIQFPWWGLLSAIGQAEDSERGYGQGWLGYAKRYGATAGDSTIENFMVGAVYPSLLHQDPRFYYSEDGGFFRRGLYAVTRIVVTRGDSGKTQFNFSEILGAATAAAISTNTYHPKSTYISTPTNPHLYIPSDRTLGNTAEVFGTQIALDTITIAIKEFWPDIHRKMAKKHANAGPPPTPKP